MLAKLMVEPGSRSDCEDVVAARVHGLVPQPVWSRRPRHIREFERLLVDEGTTVVKPRIVVDALRRVDPQLPPPEPGLSEVAID